MLMLTIITYTYFLLEWTASSLDWTATEMEGPWFHVWTKVRMSWLSTEDYGWRQVDIYNDHDVVIDANDSGVEYTDR